MLLSFGVINEGSVLAYLFIVYNYVDIQIVTTIYCDL